MSVGTTPLTIHEPPSAPISSRMKMVTERSPIFLPISRSKSPHTMSLRRRPIPTATAAATMRAICDAPASVSSPKTDTTADMSATRTRSGMKAMPRLTGLRNLVEFLDD